MKLQGALQKNGLLLKRLRMEALLSQYPMALSCVSDMTKTEYGDLTKLCLDNPNITKPKGKLNMTHLTLLHYEEKSSGLLFVAGSQKVVRIL